MKVKISQLSLFIGLLLLASNLIGQTTNSTWQKAFENHKVLFETQYFNCEIPKDGLYAEYVLVKLSNKTTETVTVNWYTDTYYNNYCTNCDHNARDTKRSYTLKPNETITGSCEPGLNIGLKIFSKWLRMDNPKTLSHFEISDITISNEQ